MSDLRDLERDSEEWVPFWYRYEVSNLGRVRHMKFMCVLATFRSKTSGYEEVILRDNRRVQRHVQIHRAVLVAFRGPPPEDCEARHLNGDRSDNRLENLVWGTRSENTQDKWAHGVMHAGEKVPWAKLTNEAVREIRRSSESQRALARRFGVAQTTIGRAKRGEGWRHVV